MNFDFENYVFPPLKMLCILLLGTIVVSFIWLQFASVLFGQLAGKVLSPFVPFFASHDMVYHITQKALIVLYTVFVTVGIDFIFLGLVYVLLDKIVTHQARWQDLVGVSLRALWAILKWQILIGVFLSISLCWKETFSMLWLVPSFLSDSIVSSIYTVLWEISLLVLAVGFAFTESSLGAVKRGWEILLEYMPIWMIVVSLGIFLSWAPAMLVSVNTPSWLLLFIGLIQHALLCVFILIFLFNQPYLQGTVKDAPVTSATN